VQLPVLQHANSKPVMPGRPATVHSMQLRKSMNGLTCMQNKCVMLAMLLAGSLQVLEQRCNISTLGTPMQPTALPI
jgi:hypothetical protein